MRHLIALTSCPVLFLLSCVTRPPPIHRPRLSLSVLCANLMASLPGMNCTAGTDRAREAESEQRVERRSFCLSTPLRYTCHQPATPPPPRWSLCCKWIKWDQTVCVSWCLGGQGQAITCSYKPWLAFLLAALYTCAATTMTQNHLSSVLLLVYLILYCL